MESKRSRGPPHPHRCKHKYYHHSTNRSKNRFLAWRRIIHDLLRHLQMRFHTQGLCPRQVCIGLPLAALEIFRQTFYLKEKLIGEINKTRVMPLYEFSDNEGSDAKQVRSGQTRFRFDCVRRFASAWKLPANLHTSCLQFPDRFTART